MQNIPSADLRDVFNVQLNGVTGDVTQLGVGLEKGLAALGLWTGLGVALSGLLFGLGLFLAALVNRSVQKGRVD